MSDVDQNRAADLPSLLRSYVSKNVPDGDSLPEYVRFTQTGEMQLKPGRWLPFTARQEMAVARVEFAWRARFSIARLVSLRVVDWYRAGEGGLVGKLWGVVPLVRAGGPVTARGEAMRYLAEVAWAPQAIVANRELEWQQLDEATVELATHVASSRLAVRLHFDAAGDIVGASTDARPRMVRKTTVDTPFRGQWGDYRVVGGIRVPTTAEATWELPEGPFTYFRGQLTGLELD